MLIPYFGFDNEAWYFTINKGASEMPMQKFGSSGNKSKVKSYRKGPMSWHNNVNNWQTQTNAVIYLL